MSLPPDALAFYLPQFHPIVENDAWWGKGFTEWRNVTKARPVFPGHYQPHEPADLGFYDLRLSETREQQAALASAHGVSAFIYYHYWFSGRRILERPFDEVLSSGSPSMRFCLAWANENWTRRWDGRDDALLLRHEDGPDDDARHIEDLRRALIDDRYYLVDGRPLILIYKASLLKDARRTTDTWREHAARWGLPGLHLARMEASDAETGDPRSLGFDSSVEFQPRWSDLPATVPSIRLARAILGSRGPWRHSVVRYADVVDRMLSLPEPDYPRWPGVTPMWDNSARRVRDGLIVHRSTPDQFARWVTGALERSHVRTADGRQLLFVNAWNEWAEGAHLEPDLRHGTGYLRALRDSLS